MEEPSEPNRNEVLRLREENLRLREERLQHQSTGRGRNRRADQPTIVNVKQVNQGCLSGCGGLIGMAVIIMFFVTQCTS